MAWMTDSELDVFKNSVGRGLSSAQRHQADQLPLEFWRSLGYIAIFSGRKCEFEAAHRMGAQDCFCGRCVDGHLARIRQEDPNGVMSWRFVVLGITLGEARWSWWRAVYPWVSARAMFTPKQLWIIVVQHVGRAGLASLSETTPRLHLSWSFANLFIPGFSKAAPFLFSGHGNNLTGNDTTSAGNQEEYDDHVSYEYYIVPT